VFLSNYELIVKHNQDSTQTFQMGLNQFTHLTKGEFKEFFLNRFYSTQPSSSPSIDSTITNLREVDWQAMGMVSGVKNQGQCDAGYAFSSVSLAESFYLFKKAPVLLSEQQVVDCSAAYTTFGCQGGSRNGSLQYIQKVGLNTQASYPYKGIKNTCVKETGDYKPVYTQT